MSAYDQIKPHNIAKEMRTSFIDYAMQCYRITCLTRCS